MVVISHDVMLDELLNGSKITTWRPRTGNPKQLWARMKIKIDAGEHKIATHYWKVRVPRKLKCLHYIGESNLTKIVPRTFDSITDYDATIDGFTGIEYMKLTLTSEVRNTPLQQDYWQIFFTPKWIRNL